MKCAVPYCNHHTTHPSGYCRLCLIWVRRLRALEDREEHAQHGADIDREWRES